jgi:glycerol-3-phosphate dehydrogenase
MGRSLLGTTDSLYSGPPDSFSIDREEVEELLASAAQKYKDSRISPKNVLYAFGGLRPLAPHVSSLTSEDSHDSKVATKPEIRTYPENPSVIGVVGVKYTTCRALAESVLQKVHKKLRGDSSFSSKTSGLALVGAERFAEASAHRESSSVDFERLLYTYGDEVDSILRLAEGLAKDGDEDCIAKAEIEKTLGEEICVHLSDLLFRRTSLSQSGPPSPSVLTYASQRMGQEYGWSKARVEEEVSNFNDLFFRF